MRAKELVPAPRHRPPSRVQAGEIALIEMANLPTEKTGVEGVVYISTTQGSHAPRVKWYPGRPAENAPCLSVTIEASPRSVRRGGHCREGVGRAERHRIARFLAPRQHLA